MKVWRVAYLDEDLGACYAWAPTQIDGRRLAAMIRAHYAKLGGYVPEVFRPAPLHVPLKSGGRSALCAWLNTHLSRAPAPSKPSDPAFGDVQWTTANSPRGAHLPNVKALRRNSKPGEDLA
jgi:hypothetical protein